MVLDKGMMVELTLLLICWLIKESSTARQRGGGDSINPALTAKTPVNVILQDLTFWTVLISTTSK